MKKSISFFFFILMISAARTQILNVAAGTNLTIQSGTTFGADSMTLTPTSDFILTNTTLTKTTSVIHTSVNPYIKMVYQFSNLTNAYTGGIQIKYDDAEINGIPENQLTLNIHNGTTAWIYYPASNRDGVNNFVLTNGIIIASMNEFTLANLSTPLPLAWLSFTAIKQNQTALLNWSTTREQNTRNFEVQHSINGTNWSAIGTLPAAGNSNTTSNYSFVHANPVNGINYYRILQYDNYNRDSYSDIRTVLFSANDDPFIIIGNPVTNGELTVQVNTSTVLAFYTADGKLLWKEPVNAGTKNIDVSRYAKGTYFLKANFTSKKIIIQ